MLDALVDGLIKVVTAAKEIKMDETTQQNAVLVEESAAAAQSLHEQATALLPGIEFFKIAEGATAAGAVVASKPACAGPDKAGDNGYRTLIGAVKGGFEEF